MLQNEMYNVRISRRKCDLSNGIYDMRNKQGIKREQEKS